MVASKSFAAMVRPDPLQPLEWQKKLLERTHVYEIGKASTCVFLDANGKKLVDHNTYAACVPIELIAPGQEEQFKALLKESGLKAKVIKQVDLEGLRNELIETRPRG